MAGQLISEKYPSGKIVNITVDNFGVTQTIVDSQRTYLNGVTFDNRGVLSQINFGNGTSETFSHNDRFQMTSQSLNKGAEVLQKYDYGYGQTDLVTGNIDATKNNGQLGKVESFIGANKQASQRFAYDEIGRLSESREHRGDNDSLTYKQKFDFDRFGNLYRKAASNPTTGQANPLPYTPIEDSDISKSTNRFTSNTTYDEAGQVITDNKFRSMNFAYDANGRQVNATNTTNSTNAQTVYDALGNRVATKINDVWQYIIYDAFGKLVAEYGVPREGSGGVKYIQQDWQGSIRAVTNNGGFVVSRTDHQAFGENIGAGVGLRTAGQGYSGSKVARQGYGLTENDAGSGQQHAWFRKLETQAGRWSSPDPYKGSMSLGNPQSFNRYSYVGNEPTNFVDPSGLLMQICEIRNGELQCFGGGGWGYSGAYNNYQTANAMAGGFFGDPVRGYFEVSAWRYTLEDDRNQTTRYFNFMSAFGGFGGGGRGGGGDCLPGIPCVKKILDEAKARLPEIEKCLKAAKEKAEKANKAAANKYPFDRRLLGKAVVVGGTAASIGAAGGAIFGPGAAAPAVVGGAGGSATILVDRAYDRVAETLGIYPEWLKDVKNCSSSFTNRQAVPAAYRYPS